MNKRTLMVATAVAALTVGSAFAQAPADSHMNPASRNAPAEKIAPKPSTAAPANRMGQAPAAQPNMHRETTGQAPSERAAKRPANAQQPHGRAEQAKQCGAAE